MERKQLIWLFMFIGSSIGGFLPSLWSSGLFSLSSVICTAIGGIAGIWFAVKISG